MSEEEDYDVFNDETFGDDVEEFDWDANQEEFSRIVEHEKSPEQHSPDELLYNDDPFRGVADWQDNHLMTTDLLLSGDNSELPQQQQSEYVLFPDQTKNSSAFGELYSHNTFLEHPFNSNVDDLLKFDDRTTTTTHQQRPNDYFSSFSSNNNSTTTKTSNGWDTASLENGYFPSINFDSYDTLNNKRNKSADEILSSQLLTCLSSVPYSKSPPPLLNSFREETILLDENQSQLHNSSFSGTTIADDLLLLEQTTCESERDTFSNNKSDVISEDVAAVVAQHTTTPEETIDAAKINNENPVEAVSKDDEVVDGGGKPSADMMEAFFTFLPPQIKNNVAAIKFHLEKIKSKINTASACYTDHDDYAALMTEREKYWLAGIQLLPVNSMNSFRDDYYFSMYQLRHSTRRKHQQQLSSMKESAFRKNQNGTAAIFKDYTPIQFENSLGKVQIGSALAPRKVIDMYDVKYDNSSSSSVKAVAYDENDEDMTIIADENSGGGKKITTTSSYKLKTLLLKIEDIYAKILLYEDLHNSMVEKSRELQTIADNDDEQQPSSVEDGETVMVDIKRKMESVMVDVGKKLLSSKNDFLTYMSVRKGRRLVLRYLAYCNNPADVWMMIFQNFNEITWQDKSDGLLLFYLPYFRNWLSKVSLNLLIKMAECLTYNIVTVIRNKFGVSVLANMVEHAEMIFNSADKNEQTVWTNFIIYLAQQLNSKTVAGAEKPVICLKEQTLFSHLSKCKKLKNGYVTGMINLFTNLVVK